MCRFYSGLILRERCLLAKVDGGHSHEPLIRKAGLRDDTTSPDFVRVECVPHGALESTDPADWIVAVDQDYIPDWFRGAGRRALLDDFRGRVIDVIRDTDWSKVGGYLDLSHTQITSLPSGLKVGGYLDLSHTQITSLPSGLKVGEGLYLDDTQTELRSNANALGIAAAMRMVRHDG